MKPLEFLEKLRYELQDINQKILRHKFIEELSQGKITIEKNTSLNNNIISQAEMLKL